MFNAPPETTRLPDPCRPESEALAAALATLDGRLAWPRAAAHAAPWVRAVREKPAPFWAMESLLREYPISSAEGLALMRLAEALLRVPDAETAIALTADQLGRADFDSAGDGPHKVFASLSAAAIGLSKKFLPGEEGGGLMGRLGSKTVVGATVRAIQLLGRQFVLGRNIDEAQDEAAAARKEQARERRAAPSSLSPLGGQEPRSGDVGANRLTFSYDMLGEGARTERDAERYLAAYHHAIGRIAARGRAASPMAADGISIKLSALFTRYEVLQRERVFTTLLPRVLGLVDAAAAANMNLTIDAEEVDRLEISLDLLEALADHVAARHPQWQGLGLAVQAYQTRARAVIDAVAQIARARGLRFMVRLVKGAYWDGEIKRAQELGLAHYPVFTHKAHTDLSYLACAQALLAHKDVIYPQFASHNAGTVAAIVQMARQAGAKFEMQRLHGMGEGVYREVLADGSVPCRVYAPVGEHRDLLAYLVRRLLENGANTSFVNRIVDESQAIGDIIKDPAEVVSRFDSIHHPRIDTPANLFGDHRKNSMGVNFADENELRALAQSINEKRGPWKSAPLVPGYVSKNPPHAHTNPADRRQPVGEAQQADGAAVDAALRAAVAAHERTSHVATTTTRSAASTVVRAAAVCRPGRSHTTVTPPERAASVNAAAAAGSTSCARRVPDRMLMPRCRGSASRTAAQSSLPSWTWMSGQRNPAANKVNATQAASKLKKRCGP